MKKIGFIGTGVMGKPMARHLMRKGYEVFVYNRTKFKAQELLDAGATWCKSAGECAKGKDAVITMVGYPQDVKEVYFGGDGIIASAGQGMFLIDMTTTSPQLSKEIFEAAAARGAHALDAPVSGGDIGAENATLAIRSAGKKARLTPACRCLKRWVGILSIRVRQAADSIARWPIKSRSRVQ